jgi:hypothetical protein
MSPFGLSTCWIPAANPRDRLFGGRNRAGGRSGAGPVATQRAALAPTGSLSGRFKRYLPLSLSLPPPPTRWGGNCLPGS